jgi:predicted PurR-regulated permease PerM
LVHIPYFVVWCYYRCMLGLDKKVAKYTWTVLFVLIITAALYLIAETLLIFVIAVLFAYLLWPIVSFLDRRLPGHSKWPSLTIVYLLLIGVLIAAGVEIGTRITEQAYALKAKGPELLSKLEPPPPGATQGTGAKIVGELRKQLAEHSREVFLPLSNWLLSVLSHAEVLLIIVLVPILSFFFLKDGRSLVTNLLGNVREGSPRDLIKEISEDLHVLLAQYMRALVLLGLAASATYALFFYIIGLPYGLLLGATAFFFEFVPIVGPLASSAIILLVAGLSGFGHLWWIIIFLAAFRMFQDYVLSPMIMSKGMELHPMLVIFGVLAGGQIAGVAGSFLSVPVIATLRIVVKQVRKNRLTSDVTPASQ